MLFDERNHKLANFAVKSLRRLGARRYDDSFVDQLAARECSGGKGWAAPTVSRIESKYVRRASCRGSRLLYTGSHLKEDISQTLIIVGGARRLVVQYAMGGAGRGRNVRLP